MSVSRRVFWEAPLVNELVNEQGFSLHWERRAGQTVRAQSLCWCDLITGVGQVVSALGVGLGPQLSRVRGGTWSCPAVARLPEAGRALGDRNSR